MDFIKLSPNYTSFQLNRKIDNYRRVYNYWMKIFNKYRQTLNSTNLLRGIARKKIRYLNICHLKTKQLCNFYKYKMYHKPIFQYKVNKMLSILFKFKSKIWKIRETLKKVVNG